MIYSIDKIENFEQLSADAKSGDEIVFTPGTYHLREPIQISGKEGLRIRGAEKGAVKVFGGIPLGDWEVHSEGVYKTTVPAWSNELYADGRRLEMARFPKRGYAKSTGMVQEGQKRRFKFDREAFPELQDTGQLKAHLWPSGPLGEYNWHTVDMPAGIEGDVVSLSDDTWYPLGTGTRFYLNNSIDLLTGDDEFYIDRKKLVIYFRPGPAGMAGREIILPMVKDIFHITDSTDIEISDFELACTDNIDFMDGEIFDQDNAAVFMEDCHNIRVRNCEIRNAGLNGVCMYRHCRNVLVEGCHIHNIGHTGVRAYGDWVSDEYMNGGHLVRNNHVHHVGERVGQCAGIQMLQSGDNVVANNLVHDSVRYGISLLAPNIRPYIAEPRFGKSVIPAHMAWEYSFVRNNTVIRNEVFNCCTDSQDTGLIQTFCAGEGNVIAENIVRDSQVHFSFGNGIYLDDHCAGYTVRDNIVYDLNHHGGGTLCNVITMKGIGNVAENNRIIRCNVADDGGLVSTFSMGTLENYNISMCRTIGYMNSGLINTNADWQHNRYKEVNDNIYCSETGEYGVRGADGNAGVSSFRTWRNLGFDRNSITGDPGLVDPDNNDFRLMYNSPAWRLGHREIDVRNIGLIPGYEMELPEGISRLCLHAEDGKSYINMKSGETRKLICSGRSEMLMPLASLNPEYSVEGDAVSVNEDGEISAKFAGVAKVTATLDGVYTSIYVLVDDEVEDVLFCRIPDTVCVGEKYSSEIICVTRLGQYINPEQVSFSGALIIDDEIIFSTPGANRIEVETEYLSKEIVIDVQNDAVKGLEIDVPKIVNCGEVFVTEVKQLMASGRLRETSDFEISGEGIENAQDGSRIVTPGEHLLDISSGGICEKAFVYGVAGDPPADDLQTVNYGNSEGLLIAGDEHLEIYSTGKNLWYKSDDGTFFYRELPKAGFEIEMTIYSIDEVHPDTQCGILVKAENSPESRAVNLRVGPTGHIMFAARFAEDTPMKSLAGAVSEAKFGGHADGVADMTGAAGRQNAFPVKFRLTCGDGVCAGYVMVNGDWELLAEADIKLEEKVFAGAGFFAVDSFHCAKAIFDLEFKSG